MPLFAALRSGNSQSTNLPLFAARPRSGSSSSTKLPLSAAPGWGCRRAAEAPGHQELPLPAEKQVHQDLVNLLLFAAPRSGTPYHPACICSPEQRKLFKPADLCTARRSPTARHSLQNPAGNLCQGCCCNCTRQAAAELQLRFVRYAVSSLAQIPPAAPLFQASQGYCSS